MYSIEFFSLELFREKFENALEISGETREFSLLKMWPPRKYIESMNSVSYIVAIENNKPLLFQLFLKLTELQTIEKTIDLCS